MNRPSVTRPISDLEKVWVIEQWVRRYPDRIVAAIEGVQDDMKRNGIPTGPDITACHWILVMNERSLETAMRWAKVKNEAGLIVRIRNIKTGDIIMGAILGGHGVHARG